MRGGRFLRPPRGMMYQTTTATTMTAAAIATTATVEAATITSAMYPPRLATETLKPRGNCHVRLSACSASSARLPRVRAPRSAAAPRAQIRSPARLPLRLGRPQRCRSPGRPTPRSNDDCGVLARVVHIAHAHNDPGASFSLKVITGLEDQIGEPVLPMAVRILDGESTRHSSPSRSAWRNGSGSGHGGGKLSTVPH